MCKQSSRGGGGIHLLSGQSSQNKWESILTAQHAPVSLCFPETFQRICLRLDGCFAISTISVFLLVLSGLLKKALYCCCPSVRSSYSNTTLKAHLICHLLPKWALSSFLAFVHFLFLHKHFCSSERVGIIGSFCFLRRACCRSTKLITPAQWCRAVSAFQRGNWRDSRRRGDENAIILWFICWWSTKLQGEENECPQDSPNLMNFHYVR